MTLYELKGCRTLTREDFERLTSPEVDEDDPWWLRGYGKSETERHLSGVHLSPHPTRVRVVLFRDSSGWVPKFIDSEEGVVEEFAEFVDGDVVEVSR